MGQAKSVIHRDTCVPAYRNNMQTARWCCGRLPIKASIVAIYRGQKTIFHPFWLYRLLPAHGVELQRQCLDFCRDNRNLLAMSSFVFF